GNVGGFFLGVTGLHVQPVAVRRINFRGVLAGHTDVAAERKSANAIVGGATFPAEETGTEADGANIDADLEDARHDEMAPRVDENHHSEHDDDAEKPTHLSLPFSYGPFNFLYLKPAPSDYVAATAATARLLTSSLAIRRASESAVSTSAMLPNLVRG